MPLFAQINTGPTHSSADMYGGNTRGPTSFGLGVLQLADTGSGDFVGIDGVGGPPFQTLLVPLGYMSGAALSNSMTFDDATFLLLTPGTYVWRWGDGVNQRFTLQIGAVPDGGSTVSLLGCALLGLAALQRKLGC